MKPLPPEPKTPARRESMTQMLRRGGRYARALLAAWRKPRVIPAAIPLRLWCPNCGARHVDREEWRTKLHRTHECLACGVLFMPSREYTVGVEELP